jgi:(2Fe-2S) ferredoxin
MIYFWSGFIVGMTVAYIVAYRKNKVWYKETSEKLINDVKKIIKEHNDAV